ncbi:MAG: response regulator [Ferruginibacter sp.]
MAVSTIVIIDDDIDDREIMQNILEEIGVGYQIIFFEKSQSAYDFLTAPGNAPFMILSDINIPGINGIELRDKIYAVAESKLRSKPYIFLTSGRNLKEPGQEVDFYYKPFSVSGWKELFQILIDKCKSQRTGSEIIPV